MEKQTDTIIVKIDPDSKARIKQVLKDEGMTISGWVRIKIRQKITK